MAWRSSVAVLVGGGALAIMAVPASAASVQSFAGVDGGFGQLGCVFSGVAIPNVGEDVGFLSVPGAGTASDYQSCYPDSPNSGTVTNTAASGAITANLTATASGSGASFSGTAQATANLATGKVGASADSTTTFTGNRIGDAVGAYGLVDETITPTSAGASGSGTIKFTFTLDGQITVTNGAFAVGGIQPLLGEAATEMDVSLAGDQAFPPVYSATVILQGAQPPTVNPNTGYITTPVSGGETVDFNATIQSIAFPITFGQPADLTYSLMAAAKPENEGSASGGAADSDFLTTASLTGIDIFNSSGQPVTNFTINTDAGVQLGPNGVIVPASAVSEPSTLSLLLLLVPGVGALRLCHGRRRRSARLIAAG